MSKQPAAPARRFLKLSDVAEELNISQAQAYSLVRSGDLPAIQIGGRNQWRVETLVLEQYIADAYRATADIIARGLPDNAPADE
ncbi:MAG: helix-turn-helix domain-containing protein [Actinomycetota bacterium]